jgi:hypothetical protein
LWATITFSKWSETTTSQAFFFFFELVSGSEEQVVCRRAREERHFCFSFYTESIVQVIFNAVHHVSCEMLGIEAPKLFVTSICANQTEKEKHLKHTLVVVCLYMHGEAGSTREKTRPSILNCRFLEMKRNPLKPNQT